MTCKACGLEHRGWVSCARAKFNNPLVPLAELVDNSELEVIANKVANEPEIANKHGAYADKEKRKAYMRELMRKRRAAHS